MATETIVVNIVHILLTTIVKDMLILAMSTEMYTVTGTMTNVGNNEENTWLVTTIMEEGHFYVTIVKSARKNEYIAREKGKGSIS